MIYEPLRARPLRLARPDSIDGMAGYSKPLHDAAEVNRAARLLVDADQNGAAPDPTALAIVNNWRSAHDFPLNGIHMTLRGRAERIVGRPALSAQRIKRLDSIMLKLHDREQMKLSQMQDIGGCRVILPTVLQVQELAEHYEASPVVHEMLNPKDYIAEPVPDSGYRSLHLKFRFRGRGTSEPWDGLKIEMQIRTQRQHRWATAVEAAGTLKGQLFKSRRGDEDWRRFFLLTSGLYAALEGTPPVPGLADSVKEIAQEVLALEAEHQIFVTMERYSAFIREIDQQQIRSAHHFVMQLDASAGSVRVWPFKRTELLKSAELMIELEQTVRRPVQVVRVSVSSLRNLRRAYPNYFLDTRAFIREMTMLSKRLGGVL
jgi:hypothetical protein